MKKSDDVLEKPRAKFLHDENILFTSSSAGIVRETDEKAIVKPDTVLDVIFIASDNADVSGIRPFVCTVKPNCFWRSFSEYELEVDRSKRIAGMNAINGP